MLIRDKITELSETLTQSERKLVSALLMDYPFAGLMTIQELAERTTVSAPSISRFVHKLGCEGYADFQRHLIEELREGQASPLDLHAQQQLPAEGFLAEYLGRIGALVAQSAEAIAEPQFRRVCQAIGDDKRAVYVIGGRISDSVAQLLSRQLRQIRRNVFHISSDPELWPEYLLRMKSKDILIIVDFRRYQNTLRQLAEQASERGASIILLTDKWISPIARHASEVMAVPIHAGTAWDSYTGATALLEAILTAISDQDWSATKKRISDWDALRIPQGDKIKNA